jgi:segregation and condensation protein B
MENNLEENKLNLDVQPLPLWRDEEELLEIFMALIFSSSEVITARHLRPILGEDSGIENLRAMMQSANNMLVESKMPFEIVEQAGGLRFRTRQKYFPWLKALIGEKTQIRKLSQAALESVAIIGYKQPVTKAEIEAIRGVSCDGPLRNLLERKLIQLSGRSEAPGNPFQYSTTKEFLKYFGIRRIPEDLPRIRELEGLIRAEELVPQFDRPEGHTPDPDQLELSMGDER